MPKDTKEVENKVIQILSDKLDIDAKKIKLESRLLEDLGMDSFGAVEVAFQIKDEFGILISQEKFNNIQKVEDIVRYISIYIK